MNCEEARFYYLAISSYLGIVRIRAMFYYLARLFLYRNCEDPGQVLLSGQVFLYRNCEDPGQVLPSDHAPYCLLYTERSLVHIKIFYLFLHPNLSCLYKFRLPKRNSIEYQHNMFRCQHNKNFSYISVSVILYFQIRRGSGKKFFLVFSMKTYVPVHNKTYKMAHASSKGSDQPVHLPRLIRVFTMHSMVS